MVYNGISVNRLKIDTYGLLRIGFIIIRANLSVSKLLLSILHKGSKKLLIVLHFTNKIILHNSFYVKSK